MDRLQGENEELKEENRRLHKELDEKESKVNELQEEIEELKEENQRLRQEIFCFKTFKKRRRSSQTNQKPKKRCPPFEHTENSRKRPDRADTTIALEFGACPYYGGELKELEDVRLR